MPITESFRNRYFDPNHPAVNGGLLGLISGGFLTQSPEQRQTRDSSAIDEEESQVLEEYNQRIDDVRRQNRSRYDNDRDLKKYHREYERPLRELKERRQSVEQRQYHIKVSFLFTAPFHVICHC